MILLIAVFAGVLAGSIRVWLGGQQLRIPSLHLDWLVLLAALPQLFAFHIPATQSFFPDKLASGILVSSQGLLLLFAYANRNHPGFWALGLGLLFNFLAIVLNGGWMPIAPEAVVYLYPDAPPDVWELGARLGLGKDIVLLPVDTRLWFFSDQLMFPSWIPFRIAFSIGDIFVAAGAFQALWNLSSTPSPSIEFPRWFLGR